MTTIIGTKAYIDPALLSKPYGVKSENYSLGITLLELFTGKIQGQKDENGNVVHLQDLYVGEDAQSELDRKAADKRIECYDQEMEILDDFVCLIKDCTRAYSKRISSLDSILHQLTDMECTFYKGKEVQRATDEARMKELAELYAKLHQLETHQNVVSSKVLCMLCYTTLDKTVPYLECPVQHHVLCTACVSTKVHAIIRAESFHSIEEIAVKCGVNECTHVFLEEEIGSAISSQDFVAYQTVKDINAECLLCFEQEPVKIGAVCANGHFLCFEQLEDYIQSKLIKVANDKSVTDMEALIASKGKLKCPSPECPAVWDLQWLLKHVSIETRNLILACLMTYARTEGQAAEERKAAAEKLARLREQQEITQNQVRGFRNHIVDEVLNLKCPWCGLVFFDYSGCNALVCESNAGNAQFGCKRNFCAIFLTRCGNWSECHEHVRTSHGNYFAKGFEEANRERQHAAVRHFLTTIPNKALRRKVWEEIEKYLKDLKISPVQVWTDA